MSKQKNKATDVEQTKRRDWELWWLAVLVILVLTVTIIVIQAPQLIGGPKDLSSQLKIYLFGLSLLVFLFCVYVLQNSTTLRKVNVQLLETELERSKELMKLNEQLEAEISDHNRAKEKIEYMAFYDSLTGLPNRRLFVDRLIQALAQAKRHKRLTAILLLDLDRFKSINDSLGRDIGALVLKAVAKRLKDCVRKTDIVARLGKDESTAIVARLVGDKFTVLLAEITSAEDSAKAARRILDAVYQPLTLEKHELIITGSIGISVYPSDGDNEEILLRNSSAAVLRAKEHGGNNFQFYSTEMNARASERLELEMNLRKALERGEFLLHYQPLVDIKSGQIIGVEALSRWQHPDLGMVSPASFIPVAEQTDLIVPMGEWVLRTACSQNKAWQSAGLPPMLVAVNVSARQLRDNNFVQLVDQVLRETGLNPKYLELELTESIMQDAGKATSLLSQLNVLGVKISIDDFGTGYSSLNYLKRFPINKLKIDISFIRNITADPDDAAIVEAIITLAHNLKLKAIAEGVETREQLDILCSLHCDELQGYLFSRPLPVKEATALLAEGRHL